MSMMEREPDYGDGPRHEHRIMCDASLDVIEQFKEMCIFGRRITFTGGQDYRGRVSCAGGCEGIEAGVEGWA